MKDEYSYYNGFKAGKRRVGLVSWGKMQQWRRIVKLKWRGVK